MKTILSIGYGKEALYNAFQHSNMSSKWFYGAIELENDGEYKILNKSFGTSHNLYTFISNNFKLLGNYEYIYMSYFYVGPLIIYSFLKFLGIYKNRKLIVVSHKKLSLPNSFCNRFIYKLVYKSIDYVFFHSPINLKESIEEGLVNVNKSAVLEWGEDLNYIDNNILNKSYTANDMFFLSTGREERDFNSIVQAFSKSDIPLYIFTNKINNDNDYQYLIDVNLPNVRIELVEKSKETSYRMAKMVRDCFCVVIPLKQDKITYCVGLTSVVEAMALGKPIISTKNQYYPIDIEKEKIGIYVTDTTSWRNAILYLSEHPDIANAMGKRARMLAESKYNIRNCYLQIKKVFDSL